jgi:hypothetical protein
MHAIEDEAEEARMAVGDALDNVVDIVAAPR